MKKTLTIAFVVILTLTASFGQDTKLGNTGKYVAFLVGANDYQTYSSLKYPIADITNLKKTLKGYSFNDGNINILENPTKESLWVKTIELKQKVDSTDYLLVYISLHGILENDKYYWLPVEAKPLNSKTWVRVRDFLDILESMKCKHILLIIDSCFGGSIFSVTKDEIAETEITKQKVKTSIEVRSALSITSGTKIETVPDSSHFFKALNEVLINNEYEYLPTEWLFEELKSKVEEEQKNPKFKSKKITPQLSKIPDLNDKGGQFVFNKKGGKPPFDDQRFHNYDSDFKVREFKLAKSISTETIALNAGDRVEIIASGEIYMNIALGRANPNGRKPILGVLKYDECKINPKYALGALMYRIAPSQNWVFCGNGCEIKAKKSGSMTIEFVMNENVPDDNIGHFNITLKKLGG